MTIRELRSLEFSTEGHGPDFVRYYLVGAMEGVLEAHAQAQRGGATARICVRDRRLEPGMAESIYRAELRRNPDDYEADMPVTLVMDRALQSAYPC